MADIWITQLEDKFWGVADSLDVAKDFVSGIWQGEWEDVGDGEQTVWKMQSRAGEFVVFSMAVMDEELLKIDQEARQKYGIGPA